jgi:hypothetical protein
LPIDELLIADRRTNQSTIGSPISNPKSANRQSSIDNLSIGNRRSAIANRPGL